MRQFIVRGHDVPTEPGIDLDDLPGSAGRLDVLCRCVTAGLLLSHGIRSDALVRTVLRDAMTITFDGATIQHLHPDERSTAARFDDALADGQDTVGMVEVESSPGVRVSQAGLDTTLAEVAGEVVQLHPDGEPIPSWDPAEDVVAVLSDHRDFQSTDAEIIAEHVDRQISIGPVPVHAEQAITIVNNYLDTRGYARYSAQRAFRNS